VARKFTNVEQNKIFKTGPFFSKKLFQNGAIFSEKNGPGPKFSPKQNFCDRPNGPNLAFTHYFIFKNLGL